MNWPARIHRIALLQKQGSRLQLGQGLELPQDLGEEGRV